ncbi:hypothetical protein CP97_15072 (plasmid) [Aurantiacibacter atlanticus]|uniref:Uncharacterized protein n=1 Tax=Aurantiacibacter atlanticus TaxID=1648404 RepID=A0A160HUS8_9SPHN|nr:hypothetical protein CP97_15072 [Aurantiacibacter atlanticus]
MFLEPSRSGQSTAGKWRWHSTWLALATSDLVAVTAISE